MDTKPWWESTTIRGAIIAILGAIAGVLSITGIINISGSEVEIIVSSLLTAIGGIMAIVGRAKANTTLTGGTK